ncbi:MAG: hypothetical protein CL920_13260 [Deltaproteobacteria bacterium]|nr:hypothetical protein [Deltaproteobacteria bacterium]MBU49658.1 hypothetical protein [Deltaproteobacteria bacterium]
MRRGQHRHRWRKPVSLPCPKRCQEIDEKRSLCFTTNRHILSLSLGFMADGTMIFDKRRTELFE